MYLKSAERVLQFVRQRVGTSLYAVSAYDMESSSICYQRDDIDRSFSDEQVEEFFELVRTIHRSLYETERFNEVVGEPRTNLTYYDGLHVLLVPIDERNGITVAVPKESGNQFSEFADECLRLARAQAD